MFLGRAHRGLVVLACVGSLLGMGACTGGGEVDALALANPLDLGPVIRWEPFAEPLPEIPFPNNVGTRSDISSPTGRRVNVTTQSPTRHETRLRGLVNELDGFGTYAPIWVQFEDRIDIARLHAANRDADRTNDGFYVFNVDPKSPYFGRRARVSFGAGPEELGRTRFPLGLERDSNYFINDARAGTSNLVFETRDEDLNDNGVLDAGEDTDFDGVLDKPNLWSEFIGDGGARLADVLAELNAAGVSTQEALEYYDLVTMYEGETETLIARPVLPLEEATTYAVVLTRDIVGARDPWPIRSPFDYVNHLSQTDELRPLVDAGLLEDVGVGVDDIAFAWTFTTQSVTGTLETIRAGLYGVGTMSYLDEQFPPRLSQVMQIDDLPTTEGGFGDRDGNLYTLEVDRILDALRDDTIISALGADSDEAGPLLDSYEESIDYLVFARVESPAFIENENGAFRVDPVSGVADYTRDTIHVSCAIPKARAGHQAPFPVVFYGHGYTSARTEFLGFAPAMGAQGLATCAIDAYGHGLPFDDFVQDVIIVLLENRNLGRFADVLFEGRARDLNADGFPEPGGDFWTANTFHTRDVVRQSTVDYMQVIRAMRSFGDGTMPVDVDGDGEEELAGDFNGDGVVDFGGDVGYYAWGQSLGGILSGVLGSAEPAVRAAAPTAGGAGLIDIATRSRQGGVVQAVFLPLMGPLVVGRPLGDGRVELIYDILDVNREKQLQIATLPAGGAADALVEGDRVRVVNLDNGEFDEVVIRNAAAPRFRLHVAADVFDRAVIELYREGADVPFRVIDTFESRIEQFQGASYEVGDTLRFLQEGFGFKRQTPSLRRLFSIAQMVLEPADPGSYARAYMQPFEQRPEGAVPTNLLVVNTVGDMNVPVNTGIAHARIAGVLSSEQDEELLDRWVVEGLERTYRFAADGCRYTPARVLFDIDELSEGSDPDQGPHLSSVNRHPACGVGPAGPSFCSSTCAPAGPIRATIQTDNGMSGMRIPYMRDTGQHGFGLPNPTLPFDYNLFQANQIAWFFATGGTEIRDDPCLATGDCSFFLRGNSQ